MWADWKRASHKHFYVNEIAQLRDQQFVLPLRWVIFEKKEHAEVLFLTKNEVSHFGNLTNNNLIIWEAW